MKDIVKFLDEETDEYSYAFNDFKDINTEYFYSIVLILPKLPFTKDVSEYYNYFALRKAKGYDTIGLCRINIYKPEYYFKEDKDNILTKHEIQRMISILSEPYEDGYDGYGEYRNYNTVYEYMLYRAESDLDKTLTKNLVMPNYNLLPTID